MTQDRRGLEFKEHQPFHDMVAAFLAATTGLGDVFDPLNPRKFNPNVLSLYTGNHIRFLSIDQEQVHRMALKLSPERTTAQLCCMLANAAFEAVHARLPRTPEAEFFRHVRNAASHDNKFFFTTHEPRRPASWKTITLDVARKGTANPICGVTCFHDTLGSADLIQLLWDVEQLLK